MAGEGGDGGHESSRWSATKAGWFLNARSHADQSEQLRGVTEAGVFKLGSGVPEGLREFWENLKGK